MSKKLIVKLTPEQEAKIEVYVQEALEDGINTSKLDKEAARIAVEEIYAFLGNGKPNVIFLSSPETCQKAHFEANGGNGDRYQGGWYSFLYWAGYYTMYNYIKNEVLVEEKGNFPLLDQWIKWSKALHYIQDRGQDVYVSERPIKILRNSMGLHADGEMALEYEDGFGVYSLNGVRVSKEIAVTPASQLDPTLIAKESNAEIRRELFRKIGHENVVKGLNGKLIDSYTMVLDGPKISEVFGVDKKEYKYELYEVDLGQGNIHPFLKMENPSIDASHFEPVRKGIKTCQDAIAFRKQRDVFAKPGILT